MKKIALLAITSAMAMHVFAMERELMPYSEKPFVVSPDDLTYINNLPNSYTITEEELQSVCDLFPDIRQRRTGNELIDRLVDRGTLQIAEEYFNGNNTRLGQSQCLLCLKTIANSYLRDHEQKCHQKKTYVCMNLIGSKHQADSICLKTFLTKEDLSSHGNTHNAFFCPTCDHQSASLGKLKSHINKKHKEVKSNTCLICDPYKHFTFEKDLYQHLKKEHNLLTWV